MKWSKKKKIITAAASFLAAAGVLGASQVEMVKEILNVLSGG